MSMKMFSDISTLREEIGERKNENSEENSCAIRGKVFSFGVSGPYILFQKKKRKKCGVFGYQGENWKKADES